MMNHTTSQPRRLKFTPSCVLVLFCLVILQMPLCGEANLNTSGDWTNNANWSGGAQPTITTDYVKIGYNGFATGTVSIANGDNVFSGQNLLLSRDQANAFGTVNMSGGSLTGLNAYISDNQSSGRGVFNQSGGTVSFSSAFYVANNGMGEYNLSGLTSVLNTANTWIGLNGTGIVSVVSGIWSNTGSLYVGQGGSGGKGTVQQDGGTVVVSGGEFQVGYLGVGGVYNLNGGALIATSPATYIANGTSGTINQSGGVARFGNFYLGYGQTGTYNMTNGSAIFNILDIRNNGSTKFNLVGGKVTANNLVINNGQDLQVGNGINKATLLISNLSGSTFNTRKAVISSNAVFAISDAQNLSTLVSSYITTNVGSGFGGTGTLTGDFIYANGSTVAPGNSPGTFTQVGTATFGSAGNYDWEINSFGGTAGASTGWDLFNLTGTLDIASTSGSKFNINLISLTSGNTAGLVSDFDGSINYSNKIAEATSTLSNFSADKFNINTTGFSNSYIGSWSVGVQGNALFLYYTAVPEPSTYAMLGFGFVIGLIVLRFSRNARQKIE